MNPTDDVKDVQVKPVPKRRSCLGCLGRLALGLLIFLAILLVAGAIYQSASSASDLKKYPPPGQIFDVEGRQSHLYCTGEGSPTVILEAGAGFPSISWFLVQEKVAEFTRVCSYDRPGFGWSEPASSPLTSDQVAAGLHQLLKTAGIPSPYILVGHSDGGVYVRAYARQYPSEVLGMVLVDSSHESQNLRFPAKFQEFSERQNLTTQLCQYLSPFGVFRLLKLWNLMLPETIGSSETGEAVIATLYRTPYCKAAYDELIAASEMLSQPGGPTTLDDLPLIVLSAGATYAELPEVVVMSIGEDVIAQMEQVSQELQQELAGLSSQGEQVIAEDSSHYIHWDRPDLVIDAIHRIMEQSRGE